jgi:hypothetical protein
MKRIISIGILACLVAACGILGSKKFNPHINGLWTVHHLLPLPCGNGGSENCGAINTYQYALINYPNIHLC